MKKHFVIVAYLFLTFGLNNTQAQWTTVCNSGNGFIDNLDTFQNKLITTGFYTTLCSNNVNYVSQYDGTSWLPMGTGFTEAGHHLFNHNQTLHAVTYQPAIDSNWVWVWNGSQFEKKGEGVYLSNAVIGFSQTANLYYVTNYNGNLVACGEFDRVGSKNISGIMQWNGTSWDSLGAGLSGSLPGGATVMYPHCMTVMGNDLIVAGNFKLAGTQTVNGIARWDGTAWHAMGAGFNGTVYAVSMFQGELYAGGAFTQSGSTPLSCLAKWNGTAWVDPGFKTFYNDVSAYSFIHTLKEIKGNLFFAGGFDRIVFNSDTLQCQAIGAFTGTTMDTLFGGLPGFEVEGIAYYQGGLYASGGSNNSNSYIARYQGPLGVEGISENNNALRIYPNPSHGSIHVHSKTRITEIIVFNAVGQTIEHHYPNANQADLDLKEPGNYWIQVISNEKRITKRVQIERN